MAARERSEEQNSDWWDTEPDCTGLAEILKAARQRSELGELTEKDWSKEPPIVIPPGKENTVRGRLAARMNEARARMARFQAEERSLGPED